MTNSIERPDHYGRWAIEPIEFIRANKLDALRANVIKYIMRYDAKDGMKDLKKAQQYLDWIIEDFEAEEIEAPFPLDERLVDAWEKVGAPEIISRYKLFERPEPGHIFYDASTGRNYTRA